MMNKQKIKIEKGYTGMVTVRNIAVVSLITGLLLFVSVPDIVTCPKCHGHIKDFNWIPGVECPVCGADGKISILQYVILATKPAASSDANEGGKVWSDGYIGLTLGEIERKPREGDDRVLVHLTLTRIEGRYVLVDMYRGSGGKFYARKAFDKSLLFDLEGDEYTPTGYSISPIPIEHQSEDMKYGEVVEGSLLLLTFAMPDDREPARFWFMYNFTESWKNISIEEGEIEMDLLSNT